MEFQITGFFQFVVALHVFLMKYMFSAVSGKHSMKSRLLQVETT